VAGLCPNTLGKGLCPNTLGKLTAFLQTLWLNLGGKGPWERVRKGRQRSGGDKMKGKRRGGE